jgi:tetratricopeptide (TPR) repeat protein
LEDSAVCALAVPAMLSEVAIDNGWTKAHALAVFLVLESVGYLRVCRSPEGLPASSPVTPVRFDEVEVGGETYLAVEVLDLEDQDSPKTLTADERAALADDLWSAYLNLTSADHFTALGVNEDASGTEVLAARDELLGVYSRLEFGPLMSDRRSANALSEIRAKINVAADVLLNPSAREDYIARLTRRSAPEMSRFLTAEDEFMKGLVILESGDAEVAKDHFRAARELNNQEPMYEMYYGWTHFCLASNDGEVEVAKRHLIRAIAANPLLDAGYVFLAKVFLHQGDAEEAVEQARTALAFNAQNEEAKALLAGLEDSPAATIH